MKKIVFLLLCCFLLYCVFGCTPSDLKDTIMDHVKLCDYGALSIPKEAYTVSDADVTAAVRMYLNASDLDPSTASEEEVIALFGCATMQDVHEQIKREIAENRFYEEAWSQILDSSEIIRFPDSAKDYVDHLLQKQREFADTLHISLEAYLTEAYQMTVDAFRESVLWSYGEQLIMKAIAEKENYQISDETRARLIAETAAYAGMTPDEAIATYGEAYFDSILYEEFIREWIVTNYAGEIQA